MYSDTAERQVRGLAQMALTNDLQNRIEQLEAALIDRDADYSDERQRKMMSMAANIRKLF